MAGFMVYWSKEHIRDLKKGNDNGPLSVIFGSHHTKMPAITSVKVGDVIYPVTLAEGTLCVMARLPVEKIEPAFDYLVRETGQIHGALIPDGYAIRHTYHRGGSFYEFRGDKYNRKEIFPPGTLVLIPEEMEEIPHSFHQRPHTCCASLAASGTQGSVIGPRPLPLDVLPELRFGPIKSKRKPLKLDKNGIPTITTLSGTVRMMSEETQRIFENCFAES